MKTKRLNYVLWENISILILLICSCSEYAYRVESALWAIKDLGTITNFNLTFYELSINVGKVSFEIINMPIFIALIGIMFNIVMLIITAIKKKSDQNDDSTPIKRTNE